MKLSIVLPTLFPQLVEGAIAAARDAARNFDYEIVVVAPFEVAGPGIRWVPETKPRGSIAACNSGFAAATGDVVALIADDNRLDPGALDLVVGHLTAREAQFPLMSVGFPLAVRGAIVAGSVYGHYYPYFFAIRKSTLAQLGGGFDEGFIKHCADPDLGLRIWAAGGRCEFVPGANIRAVADRAGADVAPDQKLGSGEIDFARLSARWAQRFPDWGAAQNIINLDVAIDLLPLMGGPPGTVLAQTRPEILDLRILAGLTMLTLHHGVKVGAGRALQALEYLRWLGAIAPDVLNIVVKNGYEAMLARP